MPHRRSLDPLHAHLGRWGWGAAAGLVLLRLAWLRGLPVNSDEPQHLHVVWAWTRGLLPYRDVFDNHTPLFHVLFAPVLMLVGETPSVLTWMRLAMLPLVLAMLWCTWRLGVAVWGRRTGLWAACLTALFPTFFLLSGQFRTDVLWAALWLGAWTVALAGPFSRGRALASGALVGATLAVSLKTVLLLAGAAVGGALVLLARGAMPKAEHWRVAWPRMLAFLAGLLLLPVAVLAFFTAHGALGDLWYGVVQHNLVPDLGRDAHGLRNGLLVLPALFALGLAARRGLRRTGATPRALRGALLLLAAGGYLVLLYGFWPLITRQDFLPVLPLAVLGAVAAVTQRRTRRPWPAAVLGALLAGEFALLLVQHPPWRHPDVAFRDELRTVLALTRDDDYVMDAKGGTVFRQRPWYYALEGITDARLRLGLIEDDLPQRLAATDTKVIVFDRLRGADLAFAAANYLRVRGRVGVAGKRFDGLTAGQTVEFDLPIAAPYGVVARGGAIGAVRIDDAPYLLPRPLAAGRHRFTAAAAGDYALLWSRALELGLSPYATEESDP